MKKVRVTYAGLISFGVRITTIFTGLVFVLVVTRQLTAEEFGVWGLLNGIMVYATIINPIITYWVTREIARKEKSAKTAIMSSSAFSVVGILIYLVAVLFIGSQAGADLSVLLFASILIPVAFVNMCLQAITIGDRPHVTSYGLVVSEIAKIPAVLLLVYVFEMGVEGAIWAIFVYYISGIVVMATYTRDQLRTSFQKKYIKKWTRLFWLPSYRRITDVLQNSDVIIFSLITGSVIGVAYFTAAKTIGTIVSNVQGFSIGLYPKLLESEKQEYLQENLTRLLYFALPLFAFSIVFAKPGLFAMNPIYQIAFPVVIFISLQVLLQTLNGVFFMALQGMEGIDKDEQATFRDYAKSNLVWIPTFKIIRHGTYLGILALMVAMLHHTESITNLVIYWALTNMLVEIPFTLYIIKIVQRTFTLDVDMRSILKYLASSVVIFGLTFVLMEAYLVYEQSIFKFLPSLALFAIISISGYLGMTYLIDEKTKTLFRLIWNELALRYRSG